jgi:hypothetical protein
MQESLVKDDLAKAEATARLAEIAIEKADIQLTADEANRALSASEARKLKKLEGEEADLQDRLDRAAVMEGELAKVPRGDSYGTRARIGHEPSTVYRPDLPHSFFRDLVQRGQNPESEVRIRRHITESGAEQRAITTGSGGPGLVPPQYLLDRFAPASAIVMHPRRWAWTTAALDTQTRPLVVPEANSAQNAVGVFSRPTAEGAVGTMQGLPVFLDANIPTNLGAGTNEDRIIVARFDDDLLFESDAPTVGVYDGVLSANLQVRIMVWGFFAFTFARYPKANSIITGTGLIAPTF